MVAALAGFAICRTFAALLLLKTMCAGLRKGCLSQHFGATWPLLLQKEQTALLTIGWTLAVNDLQTTVELGTKPLGLPTFIAGDGTEKGGESLSQHLSIV